MERFHVFILLMSTTTIHSTTITSKASTTTTSDTTTSPGPTTTIPSDTTTRPISTTALPSVTTVPTTTLTSDLTTSTSDTTTSPGSTTTLTSDATTLTADTTTRPGYTATLTADTTTRPGYTATLTADTTTRPGYTTTLTADTTTRPGYTATLTADTTTRPGHTTTLTSGTTANAGSTARTTTTQSPDTTTSPNSTTSLITMTTTPVITTISSPITTEKYSPYSALIRMVKMKFALKAGNATDYISDLDTPESERYSKYKTEFEKKLTAVFNETPGFVAVEVTGFRRGSIITNYSLILNSYKYVPRATYFIEENATSAFIQINVMNLSVDWNFTTENIKTTLEQAKRGCEYFSKDVCHFGDVCSNSSGSMLCISRCNATVCGPHGTCFVDAKETVKCTCMHTDSFSYSGELCEIETQRLKLKAEYIIAITASVGGALFLLCLVLTVCLLRRRQKMPTTDDMQLAVKPNEYQTNFSGVKYFNNREHRVMREDSGEETFFYQPKGPVGVPLSSASDRAEYSAIAENRSVYDYIDTTSKFEIQRPNISLGHLKKI